jgi:hypothetical protein
MELTLEQEFSLRCFAEQTQHISREEAQDLLLKQHKLMMLRETMFLEMIRQEWKSNLDFASFESSQG